MWSIAKKRARIRILCVCLNKVINSALFFSPYKPCHPKKTSINKFSAA